MLVEAQDPANGEKLYFDLNCFVPNGATYTFMWFDGRRRSMKVTACGEVPEDVTAARAAFDVSSHEINVQEGR